MSRRTECIFGEKCYRRNPHHFREYSHRHLADLLRIHHPDLVLPHDCKIDRDQFKIFATIEAEFTKNDPSDDNVNVVTSKNDSDRVIKANDTNNGPNGVGSHGHGIHKDNSESRKRPRSPDPGASANDPVKKPATDVHDDVKKSNVQLKLEAGAPFNFFLTKIKDNPSTHKSLDSLYITDLLHPSLGKLAATLQINFMVDLEWLMMNYEVYKTDSVPLVILYGAENPELASSSLAEVYPALRAGLAMPLIFSVTVQIFLVYIQFEYF